MKARPDTLTYRIRKFARRQAYAGTGGGVGCGQPDCRSGRVSTGSEHREGESSGGPAARERVRVQRSRCGARSPGIHPRAPVDRGDGPAVPGQFGPQLRRDWDLKNELATAYQRIGDVQGNVMGANLGNTKAALESYGKALALLDSVLAHAPGNRTAQLARITVLHGLAVSMSTPRTADGHSSACAMREARRRSPRPVSGRFTGDRSTGAGGHRDR